MPGRRFPVFDDGVGAAGDEIVLRVFQISGVALLEPVSGVPHVALLVEAHAALVVAFVDFRPVYGRQDRVHVHVAVVGFKSLVVVPFRVIIVEVLDQAKLKLVLDLHEGFGLLLYDVLEPVLGGLEISLLHEFFHFLIENADRAILPDPFQDIRGALVGFCLRTAVFKKRDHIDDRDLVGQKGVLHDVRYVLFGRLLVHLRIQSFQRGIDILGGRRIAVAFPDLQIGVVGLDVVARQLQFLRVLEKVHGVLVPQIVRKFAAGRDLVLEIALHEGFGIFLLDLAKRFVH